METEVRVLMIEDDADLASTLRDGLVEDGFEVSVVRLAADGHLEALTWNPDVIVVDLMLPDGSGIDLIGDLRADEVATPILVLTGRADTPTTVAALDGGADAYVVKPVAIEALGARLRALYRRVQGSAGSELEAAGLVLYPSQLMAMRDGQPIDLTPVQSRLLEVLMTNAGLVLSRDRLLDLVWDGRLPNSNVVDVHVRALRSKIDDPFGTSTIETVRGLGYRVRHEPRSA